MKKKTFEIEPRDVLFFRDARPMDVDKEKKDDVFNVGHGANWPRPDHLFSAVIHKLIRNSNAPERDWYGKVPDLRITGPFPFREGKLYLPMPLDWDMKFYSFDGEFGATDIPDPLSCGFADRVVGKKSYPRWITVEDYCRYLKGEVGISKSDKETDAPKNDDSKLYGIEPRVCNTLDPYTGASRREEGNHESGRYEAEYLRLGKDVSMVCGIETEKVDRLAGCNLRFGGQAGVAHFKESGNLYEMLANLPQGEMSRFVRWTLLTSALFIEGWYPNWLETTQELVRTGKVMLPMDKILRNPGESRAAYRARMKTECRLFDTARLVGACIGKPVVFSGYDSLGQEKPTELAAPAGSSYVFECATREEAEKLVAALNLKPMSDLGQKGFGLGVCSYIPAPEPFAV